MAGGWQAYADACLGNGELASCALWGRDGSVWAKTKAFPNISAADVKTNVDKFATPAKATDPNTGGYRFGADKYMVIGVPTGGKPEEQRCKGKKGQVNLVVVGTKKAFLVGFTAEGANPGNAASIERIGADMTKKGF